MSEKITDSIYFNFNSIFPKCTEGFMWRSHLHFSKPNYHNFTQLCSKFHNEVTSIESNSNPFIQNCQVLSLYLDHIISNINTDNEEACCKYFYYRLRNDIIRKPHCKCNGSKECYEKIIKQKGNSFNTTISDVCMKHLIDFDNGTFNMMEKLDYMYDKFNEFNKEHNPTYQRIQEFISILENLDNSYNKYNESFLLVLKKANQAYIEFVGTLSVGDWNKKTILGYLIDKGKDKGILKVVHGIEENEVVTARATQAHAKKYNDTDIGADSTTGIVFLYFSIFNKLEYYLIHFSLYSEFFIFTIKVKEIKKSVEKK
ncbi:variable surface protein [Plasmodium gonderi]|uniref:Variable surface protein n=1 Tax=Plasmodium gonderi TaxID=77519 RepID=A0A1Y1JTS2_PLAGO|nr:variable surface protein [Plasmodium gonderi]GAW84517.1 variable surface protein [Plasmodium gonderi]